MALATSCPRCQTNFRVVPDQLKAHRGLVRCGTCDEVFSGIDALRYVDDLATLDPGIASPPPGPSPAGSPPPPAFEYPPESFSDLSWIETAQPGTTPATEPPVPPVEPPPPAAEPPLTTDAHFPATRPSERPAVTGRKGASRHTIADDAFDNNGPPTRWNLPDTTEPLFPDTLADTSQSGEPASAAPANAGHGVAAAPAHTPAAVGSADFLKSPAPRKPMSAARRRGMTIASVVLAATLVVQGALAGRDWLAASFSDLAPVLSAIAALPGLTVQAPRSLDSLTLESFELQAANVDDVFAMRAILRNRAKHPVRWPAVELSLTDSTGSLVGRKVLTPADYLSSTLPPHGVPARSEQSIQIALQVTELKPTGYNVKLFYP